MVDQNSKIKKIFKDADTIKKDSVEQATKNLEENKKPKKKRKKVLKGIKGPKRNWSKRLFYGPGTLWGGGSSDSGSGGEGGGGEGGGAG